MRTFFEDRTDAGERLAAILPQFRERPDTLVLGLARGGIPVAAAVAKALHLPLGTVLVRKLGIPGHEETAYGALAWVHGRTVRLVNKPLLDRVLEHGVRQEWLDAVEQRERAELLRRAELYPGVDLDLAGKTVLLVDDGLATGATMRAAVEAVRDGGAATVVAAAPVGSIEAEASVERACDAVLCLHLPGKFRAVGSFYRHFEQLSDDDAISILEQ
ncbi:MULTISPECIES: phosphoribosyltransferase [Micrococcaceae]|jgi:predicted phosphoribosyltransferase|uniref:phosphoribosyltransferase n=1 Tax=Micrococcaceae TaxID=1268 RepID=UPI0012F80C26|nr:MULTISPECIES: phosphoribosyltransferase family protein [Pseudarthrobacter]MEA3549594.1 phosphoribosyltransferase family protein [Pseudarthrobacter sp. C1]MUU73047.1 phosphoribosyl transferase [Pseudarthrobacter sp. GA104]WPU07981.1 phosphoribosyltransferase family protein [Pseudarthrobacter oxydans]HET7781220.1 phosphoribosyltransferase family protein [Arthrobacter sp.]